MRKSIPVRIIGGNGTNTFTDLSTVGGGGNPTHLYDRGTVDNVKYARDTNDEKKNLDDAFNHSFNRRPWLRAYRTLVPPQQDGGSSIHPWAYLHSQRGLGIFPEIGGARNTYGFRKVPYSTRLQGDVSYSLSSNRWRLRSEFDKRFEESNVHIPVTAWMSQLEVVQFHGFGNDVPDLRGSFYDVRQKQWATRPALGYAINSASDISVGPVLRFTDTDSVGNQLLSQQHPYGFRQFGQTGLVLKLHLDSRPVSDTMKPRFVIDLLGSGYPGIMDVNTPYESVDGFAAAFFTIPFRNKPVLALRAGGKKLWGSFPYFDAAFLGGSETTGQRKRRYAGDASCTEQQSCVPIAKFRSSSVDLGQLDSMPGGFGLTGSRPADGIRRWRRFSGRATSTRASTSTR